jgi:antitoxin component YwqK of YwqJK toxin-antitoxin module
MKRFLVLIMLVFVIGISSCERIPEPDLKKSDVVKIKGKLYHKSDTSKKVDGTVGEFYSNDKLKSITEYSNGIKDGAKKIYSIEGDLRLHFVYDSGRVQSVEQEKKTDSIEYYDNGLPYKITYYKRGKKRKFEEFYKNGFKKELKKWSVKEEMTDHILYYEDGNIKAERRFSDEGKLQYIMQNYKNNKPALRHDVAVNKEKTKRAYALDAWYKNGEKAYHFESPKRESMDLHHWSDFYDPEKILEYAIYIEGGIGFANYPDGSKRLKAFYKGEYQIKDEDGDPKLNISAVEWDEKGFISDLSIYENKIYKSYGLSYIPTEEYKKLSKLLNSKGYVIITSP